MVRRGNLPFLRVAISPKPERSRPPKSVYMYVTSIHTCMNFLSRFRSIKFFDANKSRLKAIILKKGGKQVIIKTFKKGRV